MYQNPVNDFYFRNSQPYPQFPPQNIPQVKTFVVSSINEAKSAMIDPVSTNLFVDTSNGKIYLKKISNNGQPQFLVYSIAEENEVDPIAEINNRLSNIEKIIGGIKNESISNNEQSARVSEPTVASTNEPNGTTKPYGFSENARNDKWQKR